MTASPWMDPKAAADYAGVSVPTIVRHARRGDLRGYKIGGKKMWRFLREDVDAWVMKSSAPVPFVAVDRQRGIA